MSAQSNLIVAGLGAFIGVLDLSRGPDNPGARALAPYRRFTGWLSLIAAAILVIYAWATQQPGEQRTLIIGTAIIVAFCLLTLFAARQRAASRTQPE